ncbi:MAG: autotransporter-associated beta strand repeat-containing protein [Verrucomicrobia bacterium]|nr:autotransporter-associated beta strand repeat-containing protein [Verrucomicrobiota bacterium]
MFGPTSSGGYTGYDVLLTSNATINVDGINTNASNGIIYLGSISTPGGQLTVTTNDGYRLAVNDSILSNQSLRVSGALLFTNTVHFYGTNTYSGTFVSTNAATGFLLHPSVGLTVLTGATLNLVGALGETGPSTLTKDGIGTLTINSNSSYSGATFLNAGTLGSATADLPTPYGTASDITILGSAGVLSVAPQTTLQLRNNTANFIFGPGSGYNLNVLNGNVTVDINRLTSGNPIGRINNLLVSNAVLTFGGANNPLHVNGNTTISGTSVFRTSSGQTHVLVGPVAESTAGTIFVKQGADSLILSNATAPAFSGGTIVEQGTLIWRPTNLVSGSYGFGTGPIYVDGGATFAFQNNVTAGFFFTNDLYIGGRDLGIGGMRSNDVGVLNFDSQGNAPQVTNTGTIHLRGTLFLSASGGAYTTTIQPITLRNVTLEGGDGAIWTANSPTGTGARQVIDQLATDGQKRNLEIRAMGGSTVEFIGTNSGFTGDWAVRQSWRDATGVLRLTNASALPAGRIIVEPGTMVDLTFNPTNLTGGSGSLASLTNRIDFQAGSLVAFDGSLSNVNLNFGAGGLNRDVRLGAATGFTATITNNPITPFASTYKLGGGGGTLTLSTTNALTGARNLLAGPNPFNDAVEIVRITPIAAGTMVMNASNNYTGGTVVQSGTLQVGHSNALGTGAVEVYGTLQMLNVANAVTGLSVDGVTNRQPLTLHPGSTLILDRRAAGGANQFGDAETLTLNGALLRHLGSNGTITTTEFITNLNYSGAARVSIESQAAVNNLDVISVSNLTRIGTGTMEFIMNNSTGGNQFLGSTNRFLVGNTNGAFTMANGMVSPFIVNGSDRSFVTYDPVIGFTNVTYTSTDLNTASSTDLVNIPAGSATNLTTRTVYALRVEATNTTALTNYAAVITISSGGLIYSNSGVTLTNQPQLSFAGTEALLYVNSGTLVLANTNPLLNASTITKFGAGTLTLIAPNVTYANGWNLNQGTINVTGSNVLGADDPNNLIKLNGNGSILRFNTSATTAGYSSGGIVSLDNNIIALDPGGNDRQMFIAPFGIDLNSVSNGPLGSRLRFQFENRDRVPVTVVGPVTLNADTTLDVIAISGLANVNGGGTGGSNRVIFAGALNATNRTLTKLGNLNLVLAADNSLTATNLTINVNAGTLTAGHNGAFGGTTNSVVNLLSNTVLELPAGFETFQPLAKVNQLPGSAERWQSDANRFVNDFSAETYQVPTNVHLQIAGVLTNLTGKTIALNGGSLEGYQYLDDNRPARGAMLGAGYTVLLNTNSFIGQSGVDLGRTMITNGVNFLTNDPFVFSNQALITGTGSLTKIGVDTVELGNTNNYTGGTLLAEGILRNGVTNALPTNGLLFVTNYARYDLHGFNQALAGLFGNSVITNTGTNATLFLRLAVTNVSRFSGTIAGAIDLDEDDPGSLELAAENTFTGTATIHNGLMKLSAANALGGVSSVSILGGTLQLNGAAGNRVNDAAKIILGGGTIDSNGRSENFGALTLSANSTITLVGTSLITFLNSSGNAWAGNLFIQNWSGTPVSGGGAEELKFGSSAGGLTGGQVGEIFFVNPTGWDPGIYVGRILSSGEVVPVPEPATWGGAAALLALAGVAERRRLARWLRRCR